MLRINRFIKNEENSILIEIPEELQGKFLEITFTEIPHQTNQSQTESSGNNIQEIELQMMDKMRNQINIWDI